MHHIGLAQRLGMMFVWLTLGITLLHAMAYVLSPYKSIYSGSTTWLIILLFQVLAVGTMWFGIRWFAGTTVHLKEYDFFEGFGHAKLLLTLLGISLIGIVLHLLAKYHLLSHTHLGCWGELRGLWLESDSADQPLRQRLSSMGGYILSGFHFPGLFISTAAISAGRRPFYYAIFLVAFTLITIVFAGAIVSRSTLLYALIVAYLGAGYGWALAESRAWGTVLRAGIAVGSIIVIALLFNHVVFSAKIDCGSGSAARYVEDNAKTMPVRDSLQDEKRDAGSLINISLDQIFRPVSKVISEKCTSCIPTLLYLNHGIWNVEMVTSQDKRGDPVLFTFARYWAYRLGLVSSPPAAGCRVYSAGGVTLPGAAYHDFGWKGVVGAGIALGALLALSIVLICRGGLLLWLGFTTLVAAGAMEALSLLFVAPATLAFPFAIFAFLATALLAVFLTRPYGGKSG